MKLEEVKSLGKALLISRANVNNCSTLLSIVSSAAASPDCVLEALRCLHAFFLPVLSSEGFLGKSQSASEDTAEGIYRAWLKNKYKEFTELLIGFVARSQETKLQTAALDALMDLLHGRVQNHIYFKLCSALAETRHFNESIVDMLAAEYCKELNVCFFTVSNYEKLVTSKVQKGITASAVPRDGGLSSDEDCDTDEHQGLSIHRFIRNVYGIISRLSPSIQDALKRNSVAERPSEKEVSPKRLKTRVKKLWLNFLQLPLPLDVYKKVLVDVPRIVFPTLSKPIRLSDFLVKSYDIGGLYSVLALDGLFILMTKYGLEYPDFYDKLYALLEPSIFVTKYRSRFFELLDSCLKSPLLPAYLAAAFAKKLSHLTLFASPAGALVVIAMIHNLLRRHPSINCLVHKISGTREDATGTDKDSCKEIAAGKDPFVASETKTSESHALESSLWEIESLRRHYCPAVSRFVSALEADLTVRARTTEVQISDFSSGSYSTIFREETKRRLKQVPLAYYKAVPKTLFAETNEDFVGWSFASQGESKRLKMVQNEHPLNTKF